MAKVLLSPATLAGGSLAGALLFAVYLSAEAPEAASPKPAAAAPQREAIALAEPAPAAAAPAAQPQPQPQPVAAVQPVAVGSTCPTEPVLAPRGSRDGHFSLEAALSAGAGIAPAAYVSAAHDAVRQGRLRDAETALLAACHVGERSAGSHSVELADVKTQVAQEYMALAARETSAPAKERLVQRGTTLLTETAVAYAAALGRDAPRTRSAEQRLASLHDPASLRLARGSSGERPTTAEMGASAASSEEIVEAERGGCGGPAARRLVCTDPELAQLERDMQRLHAQVARVTRDPEGLRRRDGQAVARRDAGCQDKPCLLRWYAQRRAQLLDEF